MPASPHTDHATTRRAELQPAKCPEGISAASVTRVTEEVLILKEKISALEAWRTSTEADLKDIRDIISQVKLLMSLSIGGGSLSVLTLIITLIVLVTGNK